MDKVLELEKHHPGSFQYAWLSSPPHVRDRYLLYLELVPPESEEQKRFLLWLSRQEKSLRDAFVSFFKGGR